MDVTFKFDDSYLNHSTENNSTFAVYFCKEFKYFVTFRFKFNKICYLIICFDIVNKKC